MTTLRMFRTMLSIMIVIVTCIAGTTTLAAGSETPKYYFQGFGTEPFWNITIDGDQVSYSEANFYEKLDLTNANTTANINEVVKFTTLETEILFEGETLSGKLIKEECKDDSKGDTHEYSIVVKNSEGIEMRGCADAEKIQKGLTFHGKDSFWFGNIVGQALHYSDKSMQVPGMENYVIQRKYTINLYQHQDDDKNIGFDGEGIEGDIIKKQCIDETKGNIHPYTIKFIVEGNTEYKGCTNGNFSSLEIIKIRPIGGDRDTHGCMLGAGYHWYPIKQDCIRIFEINLEKKHYDRYIKVLNLTGEKIQKRIYDIIKKYEEIIAKFSSDKKTHFNMMIIKKIDEIIDKTPNILLELLKFEIMQLE